MDMNMDQWWNDTDMGNLKCSEKNLSHCRFIHHKSHIDYCGVDARPSQWEACAEPHKLQHSFALCCIPLLFWLMSTSWKCLL